VEALRRVGLLDRGAPAPAFRGAERGVSSDIWRVDLPSGPVCVKRARSRLKVAGVWEAPVERSDAEAAYLREVAPVLLDHVPRVLAHDPTSHVLVLSWLDPATHPVWKDQLLAGRVDPRWWRCWGACWGRCTPPARPIPRSPRASTTRRSSPPCASSPTWGPPPAPIPDLAARLDERRAALERNRRVLVHGDVSPKNVLVGPGGPVLLDAECATFGDASSIWRSA